MILVTGEQHVAACRAQLPGLSDDAVLAEPSPRESMAAIGLAAAVLEKRHGDVVVGSFAADHVIHGTRAFQLAVREAVAAARAGYVTTVGIAASRPSVAFGYVRSGEPLGIEGAPHTLHVRGFTEKPDAATARRYLASGEYRWNAGMFVSRTSVLLGHLAEQRPELHDSLRLVADAWDSPRRAAVLAEVWPGLEKIAIDHAVAEPVAEAGGVAVVPGTFGWDDVGDYNSLAVLLPSDDDSGAKVLGDPGRRAAHRQRRLRGGPGVGPPGDGAGAGRRSGRRHARRAARHDAGARPAGERGGGGGARAGSRGPPLTCRWSSLSRPRSRQARPTTGRGSQGRPHGGTDRPHPVSRGPDSATVGR